MSGTMKTLKAHMGSGMVPAIRVPDSENTITLTIDNIEVTVPAGTTILEAALSNGIEIPHFCYHPGLSPEGNCRMCLVEIEGRPKLEPSCIIPVTDNMEIRTDSEAVEEARRGIMEFLLLNHPLDCPWCDKAGECMLQDNSFKYGPAVTRHQMVKFTYPVKDFSPKLKMYMNRCIRCTRCIRFLAEVEGGEEFALYNRGAEVDVGTYLEHNLTGEYQGCLADVCPVGALVTKPFLYCARVFYLESHTSICPMCSRGCSTYLDIYENQLVRIRPRPNLEVNDWWMCDRGRFDWEWITEDRLTTPSSRTGTGQVAVEWEEALNRAVEILNSTGGAGNGLAGIVSAKASCEEIYLFSRMIREKGGSLAAWYGSGGRVDPELEEDFLRRVDPNPNTLGLEMIISDIEKIDSLLIKIEAGEIATLFVLGAELDDEVAARLENLREMIVISARNTPATRASTLAIPGAAWTEKAGTCVNGDGHLQKFSQAVDITGILQPDTATLAAIMEGCGLTGPYSEPAAIFRELAAKSDRFEGLTYEKVPPAGIQMKVGRQQ